MSDQRPTDCPQCGIEFANNSTLRARTYEIVYHDGPENAQEYVDEYLQDFHNSGHKEEE